MCQQIKAFWGVWNASFQKVSLHFDYFWNYVCMDCRLKLTFQGGGASFWLLTQQIDVLQQMYFLHRWVFFMLFVCVEVVYVCNFMCYIQCVVLKLYLGGNWLKAINQFGGRNCALQKLSIIIIIIILCLYSSFGLTVLALRCLCDRSHEGSIPTPEPVDGHPKVAARAGTRHTRSPKLAPAPHTSQ